MELNPINSFLHLSRYFLVGLMIPVCDVPASFICLTVCVSLDFRAADVAAHDWMVMSFLWKASVFLLRANEGRAAMLY